MAEINYMNICFHPLVHNLKSILIQLNFKQIPGRELRILIQKKPPLMPSYLASNTNELQGSKTGKSTP